MRSFIPFFLATAALHAASPTAPSELLTSGIENPQAIDVALPSFSWMMNDTDRGETQTSYQILVSSTSSNGGDLWNSGKIASSQSSSVAYTGPALTPATRYWWSVKLWDKDDQESPTSAIATFDTGLSKSDWTASFIWDGTANENNFAFFRKGFTLSKPVKLAKVFTSAHNDSILHLNGTPLGFGPARSNPTTYGQYTAYDVTSQLVNGNNAFAAMAHWHGVWGNSGSNESAAFILECRITFTDDTTLIVKSDATWKTQASTPFLETSPTYFGFYNGVRNRAALRYDARNEIPGWTSAGFDDSAWPAASVVNRSSYQLFAQRVADQVEDEELAPVSLIQSGTDWVADFGKCISGWPQITLRDQTPGSVVRINYFQLADGLGGAGWDEYTCKGGTETWRANFGRHTSFKTLRISGITGTPTSDDFRAIVAHTAADVAGSFNSSSTLLNDIFEMSERSARQNVQQGIISVDANREQSQWTADSHNIGIGLLYNHRNTRIFDKIVRDYAGEQMPDGTFYACSPAKDAVLAEWSMYWPMMLWEEYLFSGDKKLLSDTWGNFTAWMSWAESTTQSDGLIDPPGWRVSDYAGGIMESYGRNIATNALYYENLRIAAQVATILGHNPIAYQTRHAQLKTAINTNLLVNGNSYLTKVGSSQRIPLGAAWALRFGIVPEENIAAVRAWIRTQPINIGGYGGDTFYNGAYTAGGLGEFLVADLARYQYMLAGNRTIWESFAAPSVDNETNHAWTAYPAYIFQRHIAGIMPTGPAFSSFSIKPETRGLTFAEATVPTAKGSIHSRWENVSNSELTLTCEIPPNTTSLVSIPVDRLTDVTISEGGNTLWSANAYQPGIAGITFDSADSSHVHFQVGSGSYQFQITGTALVPVPVTVDNDEPSVVLSGNWTNNTTGEIEQRYGASFDYAPAGDGSSSAEFRPTLLGDGWYQVHARWTSHPNRATNAPYTIHHLRGQTTVRVDQEQDGGTWVLLGTFEFAAGSTGRVVLSNDANEYVIADAVKFEPLGTLPAGASLSLFHDTFDAPANNLDINAGSPLRQSGLLAPASYRSNLSNQSIQSQVGNDDGGDPLTMLLASFPGSPHAGEMLETNLASAPVGRIVLTLDARCRNDNGDASRWVSLSLSNQPFGDNPFVTDSSNSFGVLFRANGAIQVFRPGYPADAPATVWNSNSATSSAIKLILSDDSGDGSPFTGGPTLIRIYNAADELLGSYPSGPMSGGYLHLGTFESLWEIDNLSVSAETPAALLSPFQTWINGFFPTETDPATIGPDADPDGDGLGNFTEFAFGLLPNNGNSNNPIIEPFSKDTGILSYTRRTELPFVIQTSTDLVEWLTDSGASQSVISQDGDVETVQVVISPTLLTAPKRFVRVQTVPSSN
jgi:alpha-L-rhamnosidase